MEVFEISAKNGTNIDKAFNTLVDLILKSKSDKELIKEFGIKSNTSLNLTKKNNKDIKNKKENKMSDLNKNIIKKNKNKNNENIQTNLRICLSKYYSY